MLEFSSQIKIGPIQNIETAIGQNVVLKKNTSWITCQSNSMVKPTDKVKQTPAGVYYDQKLSVYIDKLSSIQKRQLPVGVRAVVKLQHENGHLYWGNTNVMCRIKLTPGINFDHLEITRLALQPLL